MIAVQFAPSEWGTVADWIGSVGTVGALLLTYRLLRHELHARRVDEDERVWEQARLVTVNVGVVSHPQFDPVSGRAHGPFQLEVMGHVNNGSPAPITNVSIVTGALAQPGEPSGRCSLLEPGTKFGHVAQYADAPSASDSAPWAIGQFTDARQVRWERCSDGALRKLS